jgi:hypothetical protein
MHIDDLFPQYNNKRTISDYVVTLVAIGIVIMFFLGWKANRDQSVYNAIIQTCEEKEVGTSDCVDFAREVMSNFKNNKSDIRE